MVCSLLTSVTTTEQPGERYPGTQHGTRNMIPPRMMKQLFTLVLATLLLQGCASYYSHYAVFPAENSAGESRDVRLTWQSAEYPDWWFLSDKATSIKVETQCSSRVWRLTDATHEDAPACSDGIAACGDGQRDLLMPGGQVAGESDACMEVVTDDPQPTVADIRSRVQLLVSCKPRVTSRGEGDDKENLDYLKPSVVPYTVYARKAPRGSLIARPPELDDSVCDEEE